MKRILMDKCEIICNIINDCKYTIYYDPDGSLEMAGSGDLSRHFDSVDVGLNGFDDSVVVRSKPFYSYETSKTGHVLAAFDSPNKFDEICEVLSKKIDLKDDLASKVIERFKRFADILNKKIPDILVKQHKENITLVEGRRQEKQEYIKGLVVGGIYQLEERSCEYVEYLGSSVSQDLKVRKVILSGDADSFFVDKVYEVYSPSNNILIERKRDRAGGGWVEYKLVKMPDKSCRLIRESVAASRQDYEHDRESEEAQKALWERQMRKKSGPKLQSEEEHQFLLNRNSDYRDRYNAFKQGGWERSDVEDI